LLCFKRYLHVIILSSFLVIPPPVLQASSSTPLLSVMSQRAVAQFVPVAIYNSRLLSEDSQWQGAIQVNGMVTVAAKATLTIMPGTVVRFGPDSGILVLGRIVAKGTAELPILLTSYYLQPVPADWYGIVLTGTAKKNIFEQLQLQGAEAAIYAKSSSLELKQLIFADSIADASDIAVSGCSSGIVSVKSELDLETVTIEKCETALSLRSSSLTATRLKITASAKTAFTAENSQLKIESALFSANHAGALLKTCEGSVNTSKFIANSETAVVLSDSPLKFSSNLVYGSKVGIQLQDNLPSIWGNSIYANSSYNILYSGDENIYLGGNWLGSTNNELVNQSLLPTERFLKADIIMSIYLDNAATTFPKPEAVYAAMDRALRETGASPNRGGYRQSLDAARILFEARESLADIFNTADSSRFIITHSATESLNLAVKGLLVPGDHAVTTTMEHNSLARPLHEASACGVDLTWVSGDENGYVLLLPVSLL